MTWARNPEIGLPRPDLVLFLDLEEEAAQIRGSWGDELYEKAEMQRVVRRLFWGFSVGEVPGEDPGAFEQEQDDLIVVDAGPSVEEVAETIWLKVRPKMEAVERGEAGEVVRTVS